jgi:hypothetical protein
MIVTRVVLGERLIYEIMANPSEFANWVNGVSQEAIYVNDFKSWVRRDGSMIWIDRQSVIVAYGKEVLDV